jgi:hypothetical protein
MNKKVNDKYTEICDMFLIGKEDELRKKSDKFFTFWTELINDISKNIPKPQKAKKPKTGTAAGNAMKKATQNALLAELQAKMKKN